MPALRPGAGSCKHHFGIAIGFQSRVSNLSSSSVILIAWSAGISRKTWVVPLVGQWISSVASRSALPRPICLLQGIGPQLLPEETWRWTVSGFSPVVTALIRAPDGGPVGLLADELHREPVVALTGVLEQDVVILVAVYGAAHFDEDVEISVAIPVAAGHSVPLLQMTGPGRRGDLGEARAGRRS